MSIKDRGFASMSVDKARAAQRAGGLAVHRNGTAHRWTSEEAAAAGRKGHQANAKRRLGGKGQATEAGILAALRRLGVPDAELQD